MQRQSDRPNRGPPIRGKVSQTIGNRAAKPTQREVHHVANAPAALLTAHASRASLTRMKDTHAQAQTQALLALGDSVGAARSLGDEFCEWALREGMGPIDFAAWGLHVVGVAREIGLPAFVDALRAALARDPEVTRPLRRALHHVALLPADKALATKMGRAISMAAAQHLAAGGKAFR